MSVRGIKIAWNFITMLLLFQALDEAIGGNRQNNKPTLKRERYYRSSYHLFKPSSFEKQETDKTLYS